MTGQATFLPKSGRIVAYYSDGGIAVWDADGNPVSERRWYGSRWWQEARELPDGRILLWDSDCVFLILKPDGQIDGEEIDRFRTEEHGLGLMHQDVEVFPNGRIAVSIKGAVSLLDSKGASVAPAASGHDFGILNAIALDDGGFITAGVDDRLIYWDEQAVPLVGFEGHEDCVNGVLEIAGGKIVSWSDDGTVRVWNRDGQPARSPISLDRKPILDAKMLDEDHVIVTDGTALFLLSLAAPTNPETIQRDHKKEIVDFKIISSRNVISWDVDGRLFEWNPLKSRCNELWIEDVCAFNAWETGDGGLIVYGLPMSPRGLHDLPHFVALARVKEISHFVVAWTAGHLGTRRPAVIFEAQLRSWVSLGGDLFLAVLPDGQANLFRFDGAELRMLTKALGALGAHALSDGRAFLFMGSGGDSSYIALDPDIPVEEQTVAVGTTEVKLSHNLVLDSETGAATRVKPVGLADTVVGLPGAGWAALYRRDGSVRIFHPDGSPRSRHRFMGKVHFFGPRQDGNIGLLTFHKGQLLAYDLAASADDTTHGAPQRH